MIRAFVFGLFALIASPAAAEEDLLLTCEKYVQTCYTECIRDETPARACNKLCSTRICGIHPSMTYGDFIDFMIERSAWPLQKIKFRGLTAFERARAEK